MTRSSFLPRRAVLGGIASALLAPAIALGQAPTGVRIGAFLIDPFLEPYYAQDQGMFAKAGLQAEIQSLSTQASLAALIGNSLDFANSDLVPIANARSRGLDVVVVAAGAHYEAKVPTIALITTADSTVHSAADLRGQVVGVPSLNSGPSIAVQEWLKKNGVDASTVHLIEIPLPAANAALQRGTIAAALNGEPFLSEGKGTIRILGYPYAAIADQFYTGIWVAKGDWADRNAGIVRKFIDVTYQSARWANTHQTESGQIEARLTQLPYDRVKAMARNLYSTSLDPALAQPLLDVSYRYGLLDKPVVASTLFWKGATS
jgi:ABC-type nitrate/sulfonate/bicarbonate transport system substrate-binding protein